MEALEFFFQRGQFIIFLTKISSSEKSVFLKAHLVDRKEKLVKKKKIEINNNTLVIVN